MLFAHLFQEDALEAAVMDQDWVLDAYQLGKELPPNAAFVRRTVSPEAVLNDRGARFGSNPKQIIEPSVGQTFHIQENRCAFDLQLRVANDVESFLTDC